MVTGHMYLNLLAHPSNKSLGKFHYVKLVVKFQLYFCFLIQYCLCPGLKVPPLLALARCLAIAIVFGNTAQCGEDSP